MDASQAAYMGEQATSRYPRRDPDPMDASQGLAGRVVVKGCLPSFLPRVSTQADASNQS